MNTTLQTQLKAIPTPASVSAPVKNGLLQRKCSRCGTFSQDDERKDELEKRLSLQRWSTEGAGQAAIPPVVHEVLNSPGQPLDNETRAFMEPRFGHDFSKVRVHTDAKASESARAVNSLAYTVGHDVVFTTSQYSTQTTAGRMLLAHELAHVIQQSRGGLPPVMDANAQHESDAHRAASAFANGAKAVVQVASGVGVARQEAPMSPEELFQIIVRERAWTFSPGSGQVVEDLAGVGRGVGPAAGARRGGHAVFAVIQVIDRNGRQVDVGYGEYLIYGAEHAEPGAMRTLEQRLPIGGDVRGGRMTVVVDQIPCPPSGANCMGGLRQFAQNRGLGLDVYVPTRSSMNNPNLEVAPRTAARGSQRTDLPAARLRRLDDMSFPPPGNEPGGPPSFGGASGHTTESESAPKIEPKVSKSAELVAKPQAAEPASKSAPAPAEPFKVTPPKAEPPLSATPPTSKVPVTPLENIPSMPKVPSVAEKKPPLVRIPKFLPFPVTDPVGNPGIIRNLMRQFYNFVKIIFSPWVQVPLQIILEFLNVVQNINMAQSGLAGEGFILTSELRESKELANRTSMMLKIYQEENHDNLMKAVTLVTMNELFKGSKELKDAMGEQSAFILPYLDIRREEVQQIMELATTIKKEVDEKQKIADKLLNSKEFAQITGFLGTAPLAQILGAREDFGKISAEMNTVMKNSVNLITILNEDKLILQQYQ